MQKRREMELTKRRTSRHSICYRFLLDQGKSLTFITLLAGLVMNRSQDIVLKYFIYIKPICED
jgi:hypothetical protein